MTISEFEKTLCDVQISLSPLQYEQLSKYCSLLQEWNEKINLTAITETEEVYEKHFLDCILALPSDFCGSVIDVGSGAGFPGLVWKIVRPELDMTLLEPTGKRVTFLDTVIAELHLTGIKTVNQRAEDYVKNHREVFDVATARAVANLPVLSELCLPLVKVGGRFITMKGSAGLEEVEQAKNALSVLGGKVIKKEEQSLNDAVRYNIHILKEKNTPSKYPRPYGQIKKKPL